LDYRLSPEYPFPAALEDASAVYKWLLEERGIAARHIATAGDSAGGNLAIAAVLQFRQNSFPLPAAVIAFSPWLDMELNPTGTMVSNAKTDALVSHIGLAPMVAGYLAGTPPHTPLANPLYADFVGFPPMYITAGTYETLQDNAERLAERAKGAGVEVELELVEGMQHVYVLMAGKAPEADSTVRRAGEWTRMRLRT
jgi:acetyl esterase/lipase